MDKNGIIPDIIDVAPTEVAKVTFPSGVSANLGNELTPTQVKDEPKVTWNADDGALYTLMMMDPDAPSRENPSSREVAHWIVINIPGNKVADGQIVAEYVGSGAPKGTGLHRYVILIFKQEGKITTDKYMSNRTREGRYPVKTRDYIQKYKLGNPIAGNYFEAQYDEYVEFLSKQI